MDTVRFGTDPKDLVDVTHGTRTGPIELRFPDKEKLAKLRALKREYDPQGIFTRQLL